MITYVNLNPKLEKLREYVVYLKGYQKYTVAELEKDHTLQGAVLHYLQLAIECVIDIGEMIISELKLRKPEEAREVIKILSEHKIVSVQFAKRFSPAVGFHNILVHEYVDVDLKRVYRYLQHDLGDFDFFARAIAKFAVKKAK